MMSGNHEEYYHLTLLNLLIPSNHAMPKRNVREHGHHAL